MIIERNRIPWVEGASKELTWKANPERSRAFLFNQGKSHSRVDGVVKHYVFRSLALYNQAFYSHQERSKSPSIRTKLMEVVERDYNDGTSDTIVTFDALVSSNNENLSTVTYHKGGKKRIIQNDAQTWTGSELHSQIVVDLETSSQAPDEIDVYATAEEFIQQAARDDFGKPKLAPAE